MPIISHEDYADLREELYSHIEDLRSTHLLRRGLELLSQLSYEAGSNKGIASFRVTINDGTMRRIRNYLDSKELR